MLEANGKNKMLSSSDGSTDGSEGSVTGSSVGDVGVEPIPPGSVEIIFPSGLVRGSPVEGSVASVGGIQSEV